MRNREICAKRHNHSGQASKFLKLSTVTLFILTCCLFFYTKLSYAISPETILGSNIKADSVSIVGYRLDTRGYDIDIEGTGGFTICGTCKLDTTPIGGDTTQINIAGGLNISPLAIFLYDIPPIVFDATSGTHTINSGGWSFPSITFLNSGAVYNLSTYGLYPGTLTLSGGTLNLNSLGISTGGNLLINGGTLNGNFAPSVIEINGNVTVSSGSLIAPPSTGYGFKVWGSWTISDTGTFTPSNGRVRFYTGTTANITTSSANADDFYQLGVDSSGTLYLQDDLVVLNELNIAFGVLNTDADGSGPGATISNVNIGGNLNIGASGLFTVNTATVTFNGSGNQLNTLQGTVFHHVVIENSGTPGNVIMSGQINGNLSINDGTLSLGNSTLSLGGHLTVGASGNISLTAPTTWTFNGTTAINLNANGQNLGPVVINKTDTVTPAANNKVTLTGNATMTSVSIDGTTGSADTFVLGNSGYTLTLTGTGTPLTVNAGGTLNVGTNSTIKYAPASSSSVTVPTVTYNHVEFNSTSSTFTLASALDVDGNLTITSGALTTAGYQINLAGDWTNTGIFTHGGGTVVLDGVDQAITGSTTFNNLTKITGAATLRLEHTGIYQAAGLLTLKGTGAGANVLTVASSDGVQTVDLDVLPATGTIALDYLDAYRIDSADGLLMIATNSTTTSCVNWGGSTAIAFIWDGSSSSNWGVAANWDRGMVPAANSNVTIPSASNVATFDQHRAMNNLTIQTGGELALAGFNLTLAGPTFSNDGILRLQGDETINFGAGGAQMDTNSGMFEYVGGGDGSYVIDDWAPGSSNDYYDLKINKAAEIFLLSAALTVTNDLTLTAGTLDTDSNGDTNGGTVYNMNVNGNANFGGTFNARSGMLTLFSDGVDEVKTLTTGGNAFNNLTINHFALTTNTARISGALNIDGIFILSDGVLDLDTNNVAVNVAGAVTISNGASITPDQSAAWTFDGSSTQTYTDLNATKQNLGNVVI